MNRVKIYNRNDLLIVEDMSLLDFYFMTTNHEFAIVEKDNKYLGFVRCDDLKLDKYYEEELIEEAKDRDNIIPIVKDGVLKCVQRLYSDKYLERKKEYYDILKKSYRECPSYLDNFKDVVIIGKNKFTKYLNKIIPNSILIDYKDYNSSYEDSYIITSSLYKARIFNGITVKKFIGDYENYIISKKNKEIISKTISNLKELGINTLTVKVPKKLSSSSELEKIRSASKINPNNKIIKEEHVLDLYDDINYFKKFHQDFLNRPSVYKSDDKYMFIDYSSKYINIEKGMRVIPKRKNKYINNIYLIGPCIASGHYAEDSKTIAYYLESSLKDYRVSCYGGFGNNWQYYVNILDSVELRKNDIVILIDEKDIFEEVNYDCTLDFEELHKRCSFYWDRPIHCTDKGYKCISDGIIKYINNNFVVDGTLIKESTLQLDITASLIDFKDYLKKLKKDKVKLDSNSKIGSIVMNCNPFTNGHLYLIEEARRQVDYLYIFVVEEDKSYFKFEERFTMVKEVTKDMDNVKVLPSGKFIVSSLTFDEYFNKENNNDVEIDASLDIDIFGKYICDVLNIKYRFVGTEPKDKVTNQYNRQLENNLSKYGVKLIEIERLKQYNNVVSATYIRKLIKENNLEEIRKYVPDITFKIIGGKYVRK